jgi:2-iminobutanoate/2-iminopropanoate deaminase
MKHAIEHHANGIHAAGVDSASIAAHDGKMAPIRLISLLAVAACCLAAGCRGPTTEHLAAQGALGPYSAAVVHGDCAYLSGKIGRVNPGAAFADEVNACIDAVETDLARLGLTLSDAISATVYLTDMAMYAEFNAIYGERFSAPYPARTCVAVSALPAGARVEIQVIARRTGFQ